MEKSNNLFRMTTTGLCVAVLAAFSACESPRTENGETVVEEREEMGATETAVTYDNNRFNSDFASTNYYEDWDVNDDNFLDDNEFSDGFYSTMDRDRDGSLNENEWNEGVTRFGGTNKDAWNRDNWNANKDDKIDRDEFRTGFRSTNYYTEWDRDRDSRINEREYTDGLFGLFDDDRDGMLDENQYRESYGRYFGGES